MNVTWGDMQTGLFEVLFFEDGAVVEACTEGGFVHYIPTDSVSGAMLWDRAKGDWTVRTKRRRPGDWLC